MHLVLVTIIEGGGAPMGSLLRGVGPGTWSASSVGASSEAGL